MFNPKDAEVAAAVKETFHIGHVWAKPPPPQNFQAFVRRLPEMIDKTREIRRRMEEAEDERESSELDPDDYWPDEE